MNNLSLALFTRSPVLPLNGEGILTRWSRAFSWKSQSRIVFHNLQRVVRVYSNTHRALAFTSNRGTPCIRTLTWFSVCANLWMYSVLTHTLHWRCSQTLGVRWNILIPSLFFNDNSVLGTRHWKDLECLLRCHHLGSDLRSVTAAGGCCFHCCNAAGTRGTYSH